MQSGKTGIDVDFYLPKEETAIQVTYTLDNFSFEREISSLVSLKKIHRNLKRAFIVTMNQEGKIERKGLEIAIVPVYKFLLSPK